MKFRAIYQPASNNAQSPVRVVEQTTGREIGWINRYLDREYVRRLADTTLRIYAHNLLHFIRWWESIHHTGDVGESDLTESTLRDYVRFQSSLQPRPSGSTINDRIAVADRALRNEFPDAPWPDGPRFSSSLFAAWADGPGSTEDGNQPGAREGGQTPHHPAVGG